MAHNIATINGQSAIAYMGSTPWHGLGTKLKGATDVDAVRVAAGLDWIVSAEPIYLADGRKIAQGQAIIRNTDARVLGVVGPSYTPIQNSEALDVLRPAIEEFGLSFSVAGALGNGETCWALAKLPQSVDVNGTGDSVNGYALFRWAHDGSSALVGSATPIRVVCQNTLNAALNGRQGGIVSVRHTANAQKRLDEAARVVKQLTATLIATGETFTAMAQRRMTVKDTQAFIEAVFPATDGKVNDTIAARRRTVADLVWSGTGAAMAGSDATGTTAWAAYNAVTEYFDHVRPSEAKSKAGRVQANISALFGGNAGIKADALRIARQLVAA